MIQNPVGAYLTILSLCFLATSCTRDNSEIAQKLNNPKLNVGTLQVDEGNLWVSYPSFENARATIPLWVDGVELQIALDTGWNTGNLSLTEEGSNKLKLSLGEPMGTDVSTRNPMTNLGVYRQSMGHEIFIGGLTLENETLDVSKNVSNILQSGKIDGIVGYKLLQYFTVTFDQVKYRVQLNLDCTVKASFQDILTLSPKPIFMYTLDGKTRKGSFDSGSPRGLGVNVNFNTESYEKGNNLQEFMSSAGGISGGYTGLIKVITSDKITIAGVDFFKQPVTLSPWVTEQGKDNFGLEFFMGSIVTLNYPQKKWKVTQG